MPKYPEIYIPLWVCKKVLTKSSLLFLLLTLNGCSDPVNPLKEAEPKSETTKSTNIVDITKIDKESKENTLKGIPSDNKIAVIGDKDITDPSGTIKVESAEIRRLPSNDQKIRSAGVWNFQTHLNADKIYKLNQLRNPSLMEYYPELFGINLDFQPLISMEGKGPGKIRVIGTSISPIEFDLEPEKQVIEIYPYYDRSFLAKAIDNAKETLEITYLDGKKEELVDKFQLKWSGNREIYLKDQNLNDIISLIDSKQLEGNSQFKNITDWLVAATTGLNKYNIKFEEVTNEKPFLHIKTSKEMREGKKATAYDLCVWLANKAIENGFNCEIVILPNHAILSVSNKPNQTNDLHSSDQSYIETRVLLDKESINQGAFEIKKNLVLERVNKSIIKGQETIAEQLKLGSENIVALRTEEWDKLYKETKK